MSELQQYYDAFRRAYWACENADDCLCHGSGYALSEVDTWHECPIHHVKGQRHPEDDGDPDANEVAEAAAKPAPIAPAPVVADDDDLPF